MIENVTYCDKHVSSRKCIFFECKQPEMSPHPTESDADSEADLSLLSASLLHTTKKIHFRDDTCLSQ